MTTFTDAFGKDLTQAELDFVDITIGVDTPLYLDPYGISSKEDIWSEQCANLVHSFFQQVVDAVKAGDEERGFHLLSHLREPEETHLGESLPGNKGRGIGPKQARQVYRAIQKSKAAKSGILSDISDLALFIDNIGRDKISDMTTNILRGPLIEYTQRQCVFHDIPMQEVASGLYWDADSLMWTQGYTQLPVVDSEKILLVPKFSVRRQVGVDASNYYRDFVIDFLEAEHYKAGDSLVKTLQNGEKRVFIKDLKKKYPKSKDFLAEFSNTHPKLLDEYREQLKERAAKIPNVDPEGFIRSDFAHFLINRLQSVPSGPAHAHAYHHLCSSILSFLLWPNLIQPEIEREINQGRKRIDILYINGMVDGLFHRLGVSSDINAHRIHVECKNYSSDVANEEFDQLLGRFDRDRGKFGMLVFRNVVNRKRMIERAKDVRRQGHGCVLPIDDDFLIALLDCEVRERPHEIRALINQLEQEVTP